MPAATTTAAGITFFGGDTVSDFMISLLDLCLLPFGSTDNLIVFIPTACLSIVFCFCLIRRLMNGGKL